MVAGNILDGPLQLGYSDGFVSTDPDCGDQDLFFRGYLLPVAQN